MRLIIVLAALYCKLHMKMSARKTLSLCGPLYINMDELHVLYTRSGTSKPSYMNYCEA